MCFFFFFNDTATTEIYTLSLHDALPICRQQPRDGRIHVVQLQLAPAGFGLRGNAAIGDHQRAVGVQQQLRSEEHTSELQSRLHLVCRLLLEKKKKQTTQSTCTSLPS